MRPIDRGGIPVDTEGRPRVFRAYGYARRDLIDRLGEYCSYCEAKLPTSLAVEHIRPKNLNRDIECEWENLLLGCQNCNSTKGKRDIEVSEYLWPHRDNTFLALSYDAEGVVRPSLGLAEGIRQLAESTIRLVGLDKTPDRTPEAKDRRWQHRREAWALAVHMLKRFVSRPRNSDLQEAIVRLAVAEGHWSIWMTVFAGHSTMLRRFAFAFPGTAIKCFDEQMLPRPRRELI